MELKFDPINPKYVYISELGQVDSALEELEKHEVLGLDVESTGFDPYTKKLLLVQIGTEEVSYIFDARLLNLAELPRLKALIENPKIIKLMHNGKFDYQFIKLQMGASISNIFDTMLAEGVLTAGKSHGLSLVGLKTLVLNYLQIDLSKEVRKTFENFTGKITEEQLKYSARDTLFVFPIFEKQLELLKQEHLIDIAKLEFAVTKVVAEMEVKGIHIDAVKWREIIAGLKIKRDLYYNEFEDAIKHLYNTNHTDLFGNTVESININSNMQLMDLFNNRLGITIPSTGDAILAGIQHPIAKTLRDYRGYEKLISAFGETLLSKINPVTGRIHPDFIQLGASTGRFACANPNLQQIPKNSDEAPFRKCFSPAPGYKLVVTDYSSMEMRILAGLSMDEKLMTAIKNGYDLHSHTASLMWNLEYSKDFKKQHPDLRQAAKAINFGLVYGMGPQGLANQIGKTVDEAKDLMTVYFNNYPSIKKWLDKQGNDAIRNGWSKTPAGRKRWYKLPEKDDPEYKKKLGQIQREAKNHPIQGTNADVTKCALVFLQDRLKKEGVDGAITHTVHDEVVCEVRDDQAQDWAKIQVEEMVRAGQLIIKNVPIESEPFVGDVWEH